MADRRMDRIRVGKFELRPSERTLCEGDAPLELGARAFDLLLVLAESPGRLVTKSTLIERVWPRLIVDENNLPAQIASLRRVLGAGAIRTVPGFGYRLELEVAPAEVVPGASAAPPEPQLTTLSVPRRTRPERLVPLVGRTEELREGRPQVLGAIEHQEQRHVGERLPEGCETIHAIGQRQPERDRDRGRHVFGARQHPK